MSNNDASDTYSEPLLEGQPRPVPIKQFSEHVKRAQQNDCSQLKHEFQVMYTYASLFGTENKS
jgi:hypothetical protein